MKNLIYIILIISLFTFCSKDDDNARISVNPVSQLPPATQTGANTAGCLVNGQIFLPKGNGITLNFFYQDGLNFGLYIAQNVNGATKSLNVGSLNQTLNAGETYTLTEYGPDSRYGEFTTNGVPPPDPAYFSTTHYVTGELKITHHDFEHAIISGTFWFDAVNNNGEKIEIREGRFDMEY